MPPTSSTDREEEEVIISAGEEEPILATAQSPSVNRPFVSSPQEGDNVVQLWRQLASNALGFVKGVFDKMAVDPSGPQITLTSELMDLFANEKEIVLLGKSYKLLDTRILSVPLSANDDDAEVSVVISKLLADCKAELNRITLQGWRLVGENAMSCTWEFPSQKLFLTLSEVGMESKIEIIGNDHKLALGVLSDVCDILQVEAPEKSEKDSQPTEVYPVEIDSTSAISGFLERAHRGHWEKQPFSLNFNNLTINNLLSDRTTSIDFEDLKGNKEGILFTQGNLLKIQVPIKPRIANEEARVKITSDFLLDFYTRMWFTYRRAIPEPIGGVMTSDAGWGCMIRSGQCMLAEALIRSLLSREHSVRHLGAEETLLKYLFIAEQFIDEPSAPFSIHKIAQMGAKKCNRAIGEWFGPSILGNSVAAISGSPIRIMMLPDRVVPMAQVRSQPFPVLLLIPVRLGMGARIDAAYADLVKKCVRLECSVGIVGGLPQRSFYFVGCTDSGLLYLDPHIVQEAFTDRLKILETMVNLGFIFRSCIARGRKWCPCRTLIHQCSFPF